MTDHEISNLQSNVEIISDIENVESHPELYEIANLDHFWMKWRFEALMDLLKSNDISLDKKFRALDVGCGHGLLIAQLEEVSKWIIDGVDINLSILLKGKSGRGKKYF